MALVNFTQLDFDQIKNSIKDYLRSNPNFTDYDFEGSNLSSIIDLLAYNTYITSYNANMVSNEVFIDSATLRENVVSLARNIGYVPRSKKASIANISFFVDTIDLTSKPTTLTLKKGVVCTSTNAFLDQSFSFTIPQDISRPVVNGIATFDNINVYEGTFIAQTFTVDSNNPEQKFILDNPNIDVSSIAVSVRNTQASTVSRKFSLSNSLLDVTSTSRVFFIQEIEDQRYELIFGDGIFGVKLDNQNYIEVSYITTAGKDANGISSFTFGGRIVDNNNRVVNSEISLITTNTATTSGQDIESVDSIKKYAPRIYASQNRAVTATDYESIIPLLYPETESISVFGGEDLNPPKYGKVFISIKPINGTFVSSQVKDNIKSGLRKYSVAGIVPEILDLKYLYVEYNSSVYYNSNNAPSSDFVRSIVSNNINSYAESSELNKYGARFKYSKFLKIVDDSHESVTSNITTLQIRRDLRVVLNAFAEYQIGFGNAFYLKSLDGYNIKSSAFRVADFQESVYLSDIPDTNRTTGSIFLFTIPSVNSTSPTVVKRDVGTINYEKGIITLNPINILSGKIKDGQSIIEISAIPKSNDVIGLQDLYLQLDINKSVFEMIPDEIASGLDPSASNYIVSSSYSNGNLVRS